MTITTKRITPKTISTIAASLDTSRVTARRIYICDVEHTVEQHRSWMTWARRNDAEGTLTTRLWADFVTNGYGYSADSDRVTIVTRLATGQHTITAERCRAQSRPHGKGSTCITRHNSTIVAKSW